VQEVAQYALPPTGVRLAMTLLPASPVRQTDTLAARTTHQPNSVCTAAALAALGSTGAGVRGAYTLRWGSWAVTTAWSGSSGLRRAPTLALAQRRGGAAHTQPSHTRNNGTPSHNHTITHGYARLEVSKTEPRRAHSATHAHARKPKCQDRPSKNRGFSGAAD
jgi:hypothetical protein